MAVPSVPRLVLTVVTVWLVANSWLPLTACVEVLESVPAATLSSVTGEPAAAPTRVRFWVGVRPVGVVVADDVAYCTGALDCSLAIAPATVVWVVPPTVKPVLVTVPSAATVVLPSTLARPVPCFWAAASSAVSAPPTVVEAVVTPPAVDEKPVMPVAGL